MHASVVIPARYASTRFPAKVLASLTGKPLVQHVVDQVRQCKHVRRVIVAADDARIVEALRPFGTEVVMTRLDHQSGTDRVAEVAHGLEDEVVVNVQGDEPEISPDTIDALIERMIHGTASMATCATPFRSLEDVRNPNLVKVVVSRSGKALYFSRSIIPHDRDGACVDANSYHLHLGIYAYRRPFLLAYASWRPTALERLEKLEQLRALEHDAEISVIVVEHPSNGIDTIEQYNEFVARSRRGQPRADQH